MTSTFEEATRQAALVADAATTRVMKKFGGGYLTDEDDITPYLASAIESDLRGNIGGLEWNSSVVRHRKGLAAEEKGIGADIVVHVTMQTSMQRYSKGVLVQAKKVGPGMQMTKVQAAHLIEQCSKMLTVTPASFVFDYAKNGMRCGSATRIVGSKDRYLHRACGWTSYRFFLELFRCPVGDPRLTSALVSDLPVPLELSIEAAGELELTYEM